MNVPSHLKYTKSHEWVRAESDGTITVGITEHAQDLLGDLVFIDLPEIGKDLAAEQEAAVVESVKAAADVYAPVAGTGHRGQRSAGRCTRTGQSGRLRRLAVQDEAGQQCRPGYLA